jgi:phosphoribosylformimino-5-aminoimidazole carboxamide ribotide isomerase
MTIFRPCIDLHDGRVKQLVGGSLTDSGIGLRTNFASDRDPASFAALFRADDLAGRHVTKLGPGNDAAARAALAAWTGGLQLGGGVDLANAASWLDAGAAKVIVTSWVFPGGTLAPARLEALAKHIGRERLVVDLSCRSADGTWRVASDRWQTVTSVALSAALLAALARHCGEFLVHAIDVEGRCRGIDEELVAALGRWSPVPCIYAGGARDLGDLARVERLSSGRVDLTIGSALDIFGGGLVRYRDCVAWNQDVQRRGGVGGSRRSASSEGRGGSGASSASATEE